MNSKEKKILSVVMTVVIIFVVFFVYLKLKKDDALIECIYSDGYVDELNYNNAKKLFKDAGYETLVDMGPTEYVGHAVVWMYKYDKVSNQEFIFGFTTNYGDNSENKATNKLVSKCEFESVVYGHSKYNEVYLELVDSLDDDEKKYIAIEAKKNKQSDSAVFKYNIVGDEVALDEANLKQKEDSMIKNIASNVDQELKNVLNISYEPLVKIDVNDFNNQSMGESINLCLKERTGEFRRINAKDYQNFLIEKGYKAKNTRRDIVIMEKNIDNNQIEMKYSNEFFDFPIHKCSLELTSNNIELLDNKEISIKSDKYVLKSGFPYKMESFVFSFMNEIFYDDNVGKIYFVEYDNLDEGNRIYGDIENFDKWQEYINVDLSEEEMLQVFKELENLWEVFLNEYNINIQD